MLSDKELNILNRYFNGANYLSVAQLYLRDNPLLERPLEINDIKKKIVGHFGTVPGQNFIYTHLNRIINKYDLLISGGSDYHGPTIKPDVSLATGKNNLKIKEFSIYKMTTVLNKYNNKNNIINDISLNIKDKDKVLILGKSGSGKSTLLKLLYKYYTLFYL